MKQSSDALLLSTPAIVRLVLLTTGANILGYMDRVCISITAPKMQSELHLNDVQMGVVFGAFSLSYALFQAPWGAVADRYGPRQVVAFAIAAWSFFTGATAMAWSFVSMTAIRFVFGVSEAVISPAVAATYGRNLPRAWRSTAFGVFLGGGRVGASVAPFVTAFVILRYGWRAVFWMFAVLGLIWLPIWLAGIPAARDRNVVRQASVRQPFERPAFSIPLFGLLISSLSYTTMWQFFVTWYPTYLLQARGFNLQQAGWYTGLPFMFGLAGCLAGGWLSDSISRRFGRSLGRLAFGAAVSLIAAGLMYAGSVAADRSTAALFIALAPGFGDLNLGVSWGVAVDIGGKSAGAVSGLMNSTGNLGAFVAPIAIGWLLQRFHDWHLILTLACVLNVIAAVSWLFTGAAAAKKGDR